MKAFFFGIVWGYHVYWSHKKRERVKERELISSKIPLIHARNFSHDKLLNIICAKNIFVSWTNFLKKCDVARDSRRPRSFSFMYKKWRQQWQIQGKMLGKEYITTIISFDFTQQRTCWFLIMISWEWMLLTFCGRLSIMSLLESSKQQ